MNTPSGAPKTRKVGEAALKAAHFAAPPALPPDVADLARQLADLPPDVRAALAALLQNAPSTVADSASGK